MSHYAPFLPNIGDFCYPGEYRFTEINNYPVGEEGGKERGNHQVGNYDSTEIHNYPFVEEGGRDRGATNYDCTEIHNYPLDEAGGRGHH